MRTFGLFEKHEITPRDKTGCSHPSTPIPIGSLWSKAGKA